MTNSCKTPIIFRCEVAADTERLDNKDVSLMINKRADLKMIFDVKSYESICNQRYSRKI